LGRGLAFTLFFVEGLRFGALVITFFNGYSAASFFCAERVTMVLIEFRFNVVTIVLYL
jgi:hypothetical protein